MSNDTSVVETPLVALTIDERAEFKNLESIIREGLSHYEKAKAGVILAMYEIWSRRLWQAEHPSLDEWREHQLAHKNHLAHRQTFYDHMEGMQMCMDGGLEREQAALLIAKSSGAPEQLKALGVEFRKSDDRGREATYEVVQPDDFEEKTGVETVAEYLGEMAGMSRSEMHKTVRHDAGRTIVSFSNQVKVANLPTKFNDLFMIYAIDVWTDGPDEWRSYQGFFCIPKGMPVAAKEATLKKLNKGFKP